MLTAPHTALIKATVPLLEQGGEALTRHFYQLMLSEYPEVRALFNQRIKPAVASNAPWPMPC